MSRATRLIWCVLIVGATSVVAAKPVAPLVNEQVDRILKPGVLCNFISNAGCVQPMRNFYMWNGSWWFWPEFYDGEISGLGKGLRRDGDCTFDKGNSTNVARCRIRFAKLSLRYQWRVRVKDLKLEEGHQEANPQDTIELGPLVVTVPEGTIRMKVKMDPNGGKYRVRFVASRQTEIGDVAFGNAATAWKRKKVDTNAAEFQWRLRQMFKAWVNDYFQGMTFKHVFNKALAAL